MSSVITNAIAHGYNAATVLARIARHFLDIAMLFIMLDL